MTVVKKEREHAFQQGQEGSLPERTIKSSCIGAGRTIFTQMLIYPCDVIKTRQHLDNVGIRTAFQSLVKTDGYFGLYKGIKEQITRSSLNAMWRWPLITEMPSLLASYDCPPIAQQISTGFMIAGIDTFATSPLERRRILVIDQRLNEFSLKSAYKGAVPNFCKVFVTWTTFLVAQKYFRDDYKNKVNRETLAPGEIAFVALKVSLVVSLVQSPWDVYKTIAQAEGGYQEKESKMRTRKVFFQGGPSIVIQRMTRGVCMNLTGSLIQNFISLSLLQFLNR